MSDLSSPMLFLLLNFRSLEEDRVERERADAPFGRYLEQVAPVPSRGDRSRRAQESRRLRAKLREQQRRRAPWVGDRLVMKKNASEVQAVGRHGRRVGKTPLWQAFEAWAVGQLRARLARMDGGERGDLPLRGAVKVQWVYTPPDVSGWPDHTAVAETVADLLQASGVIHDDIQIHRTDGSFIDEPDPDCPALRVWVSELSVLPAWERSILQSRSAKTDRRRLAARDLDQGGKFATATKTRKKRCTTS